MPAIEQINPVDISITKDGAVAYQSRTKNTVSTLTAVPMREIGQNAGCINTECTGNGNTACANANCGGCV